MPFEAADARFEASVWNYDHALVLLMADVATSYVQIRQLDQRLDFARQNIVIQRKSLEIAQHRFQDGTTSKIDVSQGEAELESTEATIPQLEGQRRGAANHLCILLGIPPRDITDLLGGTRPIPVPPPHVAVGLPADLLRQRPDVRAAERLVAEQAPR